MEVVAAKLSVGIAADRADATRRVAEGVRDSTRTRAVGDAEAVRQVGLATADAYAAQAEVVGPERLAVLKVLEEVSTGKVKITPDVMVNSGDNGAGWGTVQRLARQHSRSQFTAAGNCRPKWPP